MDNERDARLVDLVIRLMFLGLFIYSALVMIAPLASVIIWALILCVALYPIFDWLQARLGGRKKVAATLIILVGLALTLGPVASAVTGAVDLGSELAEKAASGSIEIPPVPDRLKELPVVGSQITDIWGLFEKNLGAAMAKYGAPILEISKALFGKVLGIGLGLLGLALSVVIMGVLFIPGPKLTQGLQKFANRVFAPRGGEFVLLAGATVRSVTKGVIGVAAIQAVCVWILLKVFGFSSAATLALISLVLSIIQIGPGLVLVPVAIYAWSSMSGGAALAFTVLAVPVTIMDSFLRPVFISKGLETPMLVILIGVLGGMMAYGLVGIFIGPVLLAVFYELFVLWVDAEPEPDDAVSGDPE